MKIERKEPVSDVNIVTLSTATYNKLKNENMRGRMFLDYILDQSTYSRESDALVVDSETVVTALQFCYADLYKRQVESAKAELTQVRRNDEDEVELTESVGDEE